MRQRRPYRHLTAWLPAEEKSVLELALALTTSFWVPLRAHGLPRGKGRNLFWLDTVSSSLRELRRAAIKADACTIATSRITSGRRRQLHGGNVMRKHRFTLPKRAALITGRLFDAPPNCLQSCEHSQVRCCYVLSLRCPELVEGSRGRRAGCLVLCCNSSYITGT